MSKSTRIGLTALIATLVTAAGLWLILRATPRTITLLQSVPEWASILFWMVFVMVVASGRRLRLRRR